MKHTALVSLATLLLATTAACGDDSDGSGGAGGTSTSDAASTSGPSSSASNGSSSSRASSGVGSTAGSGGSGGDTGSGGSGGDTGSGGSGGDTGSGGSGGDTGSGGSGGGLEGFENVSETPGTISHDGVLAWVGDTVVAAWSEPDSEQTSDQDIATRTREDGEWSALDFRTSDEDVQNAFPSIVTDGTVADLFWNGFPEGTNDIFHARWEAGAWSARENLTGAFEDDALRGDYDPAGVALAAGGWATAYLSAAVDEDGAFLGASEVRVVDDDGGAPVTVIAMEDDSDCYEVAAVEAEGRLRVVASCGFGGASLWYAERSTEGVWSDQEELLETDAGLVALAPSPGGFDVAFAKFADCDSGEFCVSWLRVDDDGVASQADVESPDGMYWPALAVDEDGSPLIAYHAFNDDNWGDVFLVRGAPTGGDFGDPLNLTPGTDDTDETFPSQVHIEDDGRVSVVFEAVLADSDPLDGEVLIATVEF